MRTWVKRLAGALLVVSLLAAFGLSAAAPTHDAAGIMGQSGPTRGW